MANLLLNIPGWKDAQFITTCQILMGKGEKNSTEIQNVKKKKVINTPQMNGVMRSTLSGLVMMKLEWTLKCTRDIFLQCSSWICVCFMSSAWHKSIFCPRLK